MSHMSESLRRVRLSRRLTRMVMGISPLKNSGAITRIEAEGLRATQWDLGAGILLFVSIPARRLFWQMRDSS